MGTSKSRDAWVGSALVYSGRRDPNWRVSNAIGEKLQRLWKKMPTAPKPGPDPTGLGYRGAVLRGPGGREWIAFGGVVSLRTPEGVETRRDSAMEFEKTLLASAPLGLLPEEMLTGGG